MGWGWTVRKGLRRAQEVGDGGSSANPGSEGSLGAEGGQTVLGSWGASRVGRRGRSGTETTVVEPWRLGTGSQCPLCALLGAGCSGWGAPPAPCAESRCHAEAPRLTQRACSTPSGFSNLNVGSDPGDFGCQEIPGGAGPWATGAGQLQASPAAPRPPLGPETTTSHRAMRLDR